MQALQHTVYQYSQRLKALEDFISFQFGEAYQQFCSQKSEDDEETEEKPSFNLADLRKNRNTSRIKREFVPSPEVEEEEDDETSCLSAPLQSSSSQSNSKTDLMGLRCLVPESLEVDFVSSPASESVDPLDGQEEEGFWNNDTENGDTNGTEGYEINNSEIYEIYEDDDDQYDEQEMETMPQITGTASFTSLFEVSGSPLQLAKSHECPFCDNRYDSRNVMFQHILDDHTGGENYCPKCQKTYTFQKDFRCHLSRHDKRNSIRFKCSYCVKYFGSRKELNNHERIHTGEKPYSCATCQRVFRTSSSLIRHQKCHGSHVCKIGDCKLRFVHYNELILHQATTDHFFTT